MTADDYMKMNALFATDAVNDPPATDATVLAWALDVDPSPPFRDIPWTEYLIWLGENDGLERLEVAIGAGVTAATRSASRLAVTVANSGEPLQLSDSRVRALLGKVVPSVFTVAEKDALLAVSQGTPTRFEAADIPWPAMDNASELYHVNYARSL